MKLFLVNCYPWIEKLLDIFPGVEICPSADEANIIVYKTEKIRRVIPPNDDSVYIILDNDIDTLIETLKDIAP